MYLSRTLGGTPFIYFWCGLDKAVNNDYENHLFGEPFYVSEDNQTRWRKSSRPDMIAPELLTYWGIEV